MSSLGKRKYSDGEPFRASKVGRWMQYDRKKRAGFTGYNPPSLTAKVNRLLGDQEKKNLDVTGTFNTVANTAVITPICNIAQGDTATQRDGRKVQLVSLTVRAQVISPTTQSQRVIFVYDRQSNSAGPTAADILEVGTNVNSPMNLANSKRFTVLYDSFNGLNHGVTFFASTGSNVVYMKFTRKMDFPQEYGTAADPTVGGLYMLTLSTGIASNTHYTRVRFTDS